MKAVPVRNADGKITCWRVAIDLGIIDGKRVRKWVSGKTKREAERKYEALKADQARGADIRKGKVTFAVFLPRWLAYKAPRVRPHTLESYEHIVTAYLVPKLGHIKLAQLTPNKVDELLTELSTATSERPALAPNYVKKIRAVLGAALRQAQRWGDVVRNVAADSEPIKAERFKAKPPTDAQIRKLLSACQGHRYEALAHVLAKTGFRKGEALAIRWEDVDLDQGLLTVTGSLQRQKRAQRAEGESKTELVRSDTTKSEAGHRVMVLTPHLVAVLRQHQTAQLWDAAAAGELWHDTGYVFTTAHGKPLEPRNVSQAYRAQLVFTTCATPTSPR